MEQKLNSVWPAVLVICALLIVSQLFVGYGLAGVIKDQTKAKVDLTSVEDKISGLDGKLGSLDTKLDSVEQGLTEVKDKVSAPDFGTFDEEETMKSKAEELVLAELGTKDFKRAVFDALNLFYNGTVEYSDCLSDDSCPVESYKHITDIQVKDTDTEVVVENETAEVTLSVKVYYYVDGDEDEEMRAKLVEFVISVKELEYKDEFEDAEVVTDYTTPGFLVVEKVYE